MLKQRFKKMVNWWRMYSCIISLYFNDTKWLYSIFLEKKIDGGLWSLFHPQNGVDCEESHIKANTLREMTLFLCSVYHQFSLNIDAMKLEN